MPLKPEIQRGKSNWWPTSHVVFNFSLFPSSSPSALFSFACSLYLKRLVEFVIVMSLGLLGKTCEKEKWINSGPVQINTKEQDKREKFLLVHVLHTFVFLLH